MWYLLLASEEGGEDFGWGWSGGDAKGLQRRREGREVVDEGIGGGVDVKMLEVDCLPQELIEIDSTLVCAGEAESLEVGSDSSKRREEARVLSEGPVGGLEDEVGEIRDVARVEESPVDTLVEAKGEGESAEKGEAVRRREEVVDAGEV
jgi:hypothetical protein